MIKVNSSGIKNYQNGCSNWLDETRILMGQIEEVHIDNLPYTYDVYSSQFQKHLKNVPVQNEGNLYWCPQKGEKVIMSFIDGRKDLPVIIGQPFLKSINLQTANGIFLNMDSKGTINIQVKGNNIIINSDGIMFNNGNKGIARVGDTVQVDINGTTYSGTITSGSENIKA